ncbi:hypothetical protein GCK32_009194 [Trichostrongylus colubriformis]|uniref:Uncharacterized protein n=1 Tax=Trichostrongylus colubriformis TaxID=6319 RepID=A0AAN8GAD0_TRICO
MMQHSSRSDKKAPSSASETIQATAAACSSSLSRKASQRTSRKKTSIFDPIPSKKQPPATVVHSVSDEDDVIAVGDVDMAATARCSSTFGYKITASPILSNRSSDRNDTSSTSSRNTKRPAKKSSIFDPKPNKKQHLSAKVEESIPDDESEPIERPDVKDILKLVSSGKRYDNGDDEAETEDTKGLEIERVVAKLSELVHYADLERPPKPKPVVKSSHSECSKLPNFKRFKKASQGRFNSSLSSVSISCVIGGSEDLVDFRQLPQVA